MFDSKKVDGFEFTSITFPHNVDDAICIYKRNVKKYVRYINKKGIEKAVITNDVKSLDFLKQCPSLKYLNIIGGIDYTPLYEMKEIKLLSISNYCSKSDTYYEIDLNKIKGLETLGVGYNKGIKNLNKLTELKTLFIGDLKEEDLMKINQLRNLDTLRLLQCNIKSLNGIQYLNKLKILYLEYIRGLKDISQLESVKNTLSELRIESCRRIEDYSSITHLISLVFLRLYSCPPIQNLSILENLYSLKTFLFDINVLDGNLSLCTNLSYVYSARNRKHYSHKDKDLPKGKYINGNDSIEEYRKFC